VAFYKCHNLEKGLECHDHDVLKAKNSFLRREISLTLFRAQTQTAETVVTHIHIQQLTCEYTEITSDIAYVHMND